MSSLQADRTGRPSTSSKAKKDQTRKFNLKPIGAAVIKTCQFEIEQKDNKLASIDIISRNLVLHCDKKCKKQIDNKVFRVNGIIYILDMFQLLLV